MSSPPYMRFYVGDYLADTAHLTYQEHGVYMLLLMGMWRAGGKLPANDAKLAKVAQCTPKQWAAMKDTILDFFQRRGGSITQKRMLREMSVYADKIERAKRGGKASAFQKAKENNAKNTKQLQANFNQPEPEPDSRTEPLQGSSSTSDASEPARPEGAVTSRPKLTVVPKHEPARKPVKAATKAEREAEIARILAKPKPAPAFPTPDESPAQMAERLRKSLGGAV